MSYGGGSADYLYPPGDGSPGYLYAAQHQNGQPLAQQQHHYSPAPLPTPSSGLATSLASMHIGHTPSPSRVRRKPVPNQTLSPSSTQISGAWHPNSHPPSSHPPGFPTHPNHTIATQPYTQQWPAGVSHGVVQPLISELSSERPPPIISELEAPLVHPSESRIPAKYHPIHQHQSNVAELAGSEPVQRSSSEPSQLQPPRTGDISEPPQSTHEGGGPPSTAATSSAYQASIPAQQGQEQLAVVEPPGSPLGVGPENLESMPAPGTTFLLQGAIISSATDRLIPQQPLPNGPASQATADCGLAIEAQATMSTQPSNHPQRLTSSPYPTESVYDSQAILCPPPPPTCGVPAHLTGMTTLPRATSPSQPATCASPPAASATHHASASASPAPSHPSTFPLSPPPRSESAFPPAPPLSAPIYNPSAFPLPPSAFAPPPASPFPRPSSAYFPPPPPQQRPHAQSVSSSSVQKIGGMAASVFSRERKVGLEKWSKKQAGRLSVAVTGLKNAATSAATPKPALPPRPVSGYYGRALSDGIGGDGNNNGQQQHLYHSAEITATGYSAPPQEPRRGSYPLPQGHGQLPNQQLPNHAGAFNSSFSGPEIGGQSQGTMQEPTPLPQGNLVQQWPQTVAPHVTRSMLDSQQSEVGGELHTPPIQSTQPSQSIDCPVGQTQAQAQGQGGEGMVSAFTQDSYTNGQQQYVGHGYGNMTSNTQQSYSPAGLSVTYMPSAQAQEAVWPATQHGQPPLQSQQQQQVGSHLGLTGQIPRPGPANQQTHGPFRPSLPLGNAGVHESWSSGLVSPPAVPHAATPTVPPQRPPHTNLGMGSGRPQIRPQGNQPQNDNNNGHPSRPLSFAAPPTAAAVPGPTVTSITGQVQGGGATQMSMLLLGGGGDGEGGGGDGAVTSDAGADTSAVYDDSSFQNCDYTEHGTSAMEESTQAADYQTAQNTAVIDDINAIDASKAGLDEAYINALQGDVMRQNMIDMVDYSTTYETTAETTYEGSSYDLIT